MPRIHGLLGIHVVRMLPLPRQRKRRRFERDVIRRQTAPKREMRERYPFAFVLGLETSGLRQLFDVTFVLDLTRRNLFDSYP